MGQGMSICVAITRDRLVVNVYPYMPECDQQKRMRAVFSGDARVNELWRFSCEGFLAALTREHTERAVRFEFFFFKQKTAYEIPFRMLRPTIANEADRES